MSGPSPAIKQQQCCHKQEDSSRLWVGAEGGWEGEDRRPPPTPQAQPGTNEATSRIRNLCSTMFQECSHLPEQLLDTTGPWGPASRRVSPLPPLPTMPGGHRDSRGLAVVMGHRGCCPERPPNPAAPGHRAGGDLAVMLGSGPCPAVIAHFYTEGAHKEGWAVLASPWAVVLGVGGWKQPVVLLHLSLWSEPRGHAPARDRAPLGRRRPDADADHLGGAVFRGASSHVQSAVSSCRLCRAEPAQAPDSSRLNWQQTPTNIKLGDGLCVGLRAMGTLEVGG